MSDFKRRQESRASAQETLFGIMEQAQAYSDVSPEEADALAAEAVFAARLDRALDKDEEISASRDPDDNTFLVCAVAASADYIVSGDNDPLAPGSCRGIPILPPAVFLAMPESGSSL